MNDFENLSKIYSAFIIEYRKSMGEDYTQTIEDLLLEMGYTLNLAVRRSF